MRTKDQILLENLYKNYVLFESVKKSFLDDFYFLLEKGMSKLGLFTNSMQLNSILNNFEDSVQYRQYRSKIQKEMSDFINNNFLNKLSGIPFDLQKIEAYIQVDPNINENFHMGAFYNPEQSLSRIIITLSDIVRDKNDFKNEVCYTLFHEMVHARQAYEAKSRNEILIPPKFSLGGERNRESWENDFKNYFMHPTELEAYALEYNFRNNNDPSNIEGFVIKFLKRLGFDEKEKTLMDLYQDYIKVFSEYVKNYKYIET